MSCGRREIEIKQLTLGFQDVSEVTLKHSLGTLPSDNGDVHENVAEK